MSRFVVAIIPALVLCLGTPMSCADDIDLDFVEEIEGNSFTKRWMQRSALRVEGVRISLVAFDTSSSDNFSLTRLSFPNNQGGFASTSVADSTFIAQRASVVSLFRFDVKFDGDLLDGTHISRSNQIDYAWDIEYIEDGKITSGYRWSNNTAYAMGFDPIRSNSGGGTWYAIPANELSVIPLPSAAVMAGLGLGVVGSRRRRLETSQGASRGG